MADEERNPRTAGYKRTNAVFERSRAKAVAADHDPARESLVLLLAAAPEPSPDWLAGAAGRAFAGEPADAAGDDGTVRVGGWEFGVRWAGRQFTPAPDGPVPTPPFDHPHAGWVSAELLTAPAHTSAADRLARVGRLLAALVPDGEGTDLFQPSSGHLGPLTAEAAAALVAGRVADAVRLAAAAAEAGRRFGEFLEAFARRRPGDTFAVKAVVADDHGREVVWVTVADVDAASVRGHLDGAPARVRAVRAGDEVRVPTAGLTDWLYVRGGRMVGGFTLSADDRPRRTDAA